MATVDGSSSRPELSRRMLIVATLGLASLPLLRRDAIGFSVDGAESRLSAELDRAAERAGSCTAANAVGVGLRGEYFEEESCAGAPLLVRVDGVVDFDQDLEWPTGNAARPRSIRWSGWIKPPLSGHYRFHAGAPAMQILVVRQPVAGDGAPPDATLSMAAGRFYPIVVEVSRLAQSTVRLRLEWTAPHGARFLVPRALLHLPTETVTTPRT